MKRRDLIKSSAIIAGITALSGCIADNKKSPSADKNSAGIIPKQTDIYKFSVPLPYDFEQIDRLKELNSEFKKSKIVTLYNSYPAPLCYIFGGEFQTRRGSENKKIKNFNDFAKYVRYAKDRGFNFVYTLNNPKPFFQKDFEKYKDHLFELLNNLKSIGCNDLKIANQQLMYIINQANPGFNFVVSTSSEYHSIQQYNNLIKSHPNIKSINLSIDDNRNFLLLKNLKKKFPKVEQEIIVNETCIQGCPSRIIHPSTHFCHFDCLDIAKKMGYFEFFFKSNLIYPWQLPYYSSMGINNFKYMFYNRGNVSDIYNENGKKMFLEIADLKNYLSCIENGIENMTAKQFFDMMRMDKTEKIKDNIKLTEILPYLPQIEHFIENGHKCSSICTSECNYCYDCAKKFKEMVV